MDSGNVQPVALTISVFIVWPKCELVAVRAVLVVSLEICVPSSTIRKSQLPLLPIPSLITQFSKTRLYMSVLLVGAPVSIDWITIF